VNILKFYSTERKVKVDSFPEKRAEVLMYNLDSVAANILDLFCGMGYKN
jgi:hypothetical protein